MGEVKYPNNAEVVIDELKDVQTFKETEIGKTVLDFNDYGIVTFPSSVGKNFALGTIGQTLIKVGYIGGTGNGGVAYTNVGNRIAITTDTAWQTTTFTPPAGQSPTDPYGQPLLQISGNYNIPLAVATGPNYVYIDYIRVVDDSKTVIDEDDIPVEWYTNYNDGYKITVTGAPGLPTSTSLFLGTVTASGGTITAIDEAGSLFPNVRVYAQQRTNTITITTPADDTDVTEDYTYNTSYTLDKHIKAKGTAGISHTNPHGISAEDLGIFPDATVNTHQQQLHASGLINASTTSTTSALYGYIDGASFKIRPLTSTEKLAIYGSVYGDTSDVMYRSITGDTEVTFATEYNSGAFSGAAFTYYFYIDITSPTLPVLTFSTSSMPSGNSYYPIVSVQWTGAILQNVIDYRMFQNNKPLNIYPITARKNIQGQFGYDTFLDSIEYYNGTDWIALNREYFTTSDQTGTGADQSFEHDLGDIPACISVFAVETGVTITNVWVDINDIHATVTAGKKFRVYAKRVIVT